MKKAKNNSIMPYRILAYISLCFMFVSCNGQENPKYIGHQYGIFDLGKITFSEQLDTLVSQSEKYYKLPKGAEYFDERLKRYALKDTVYYIYRIPPKFIAEGTFRFNGLDIKPKEVVDFYTDHSNNFRKVEVSVYLNDKQYQQLRATCIAFRDVTPGNVMKVNKGKYMILQDVDMKTQIQTTLYCLALGEENDPDHNYFVRISRISLKIKTDGFYKQLKDEITTPSVNSKN